MVSSVRRNARTILVGVIIALFAGAVPAMAAFDAKNADKVDGKHAVGAGASLSAARGKLVATGTSGKFAAKFIPKVADANKLDGIDSTGFLSATGKALDADKLDGIDSTGFYAAGSKVADSHMLDGMNSDAFLGATATAADADKLDGLDSQQFLTGLSRLHYLGTNSLAPAPNYVELRSVGGFTKARPNTMVKVTWNGHATVSGTFCEFQMRVDGKKDTGSASSEWEAASGASAVVYAADAPVAVTGFFPNLAAGAHTVSIWLRGSATSCILNRGNFAQDVYVEEILLAS